jgi:hypothetical protein
VFEIGLEGGLNGDANDKSRNLSGGLEARRVTGEWKFEFQFEYDYEDERLTDQEFDSLGVLIGEETHRNLQRSESSSRSSPHPRCASDGCSSAIPTTLKT